VEEIAVDEDDSDTSLSEVEITDSDSDVYIQTQKWVEVETSGSLHNIKHLRRAQDNTDGNKAVYSQIFLC
jgi:hypothetical protein